MSLIRRIARRVRVWVRQGLARALDRLYEGPKPPDRLQGFIYEYMRFYPRATRAEWMVFSLRLGDEMYKSGFSRGYERGQAEARHLQAMGDEEWAWSPDQPNLNELALAEPVPEDHPDLPTGMSPEELANWYTYRTHHELAGTRSKP